MNKKNLCIFGGLVFVSLASLFDNNAYVKVGMALLGAVLLVVSSKYENNDK
jgi:hypothetical protein